MQLREVSVLLAKDLKPILKFRFIWVKAISFLASIETVIVQLKYPNLSFPSFGICPIYNLELHFINVAVFGPLPCTKTTFVPQEFLYQVYTLIPGFMIYSLTLSLPILLTFLQRILCFIIALNNTHFGQKVLTFFFLCLYTQSNVAFSP